MRKWKPAIAATSPQPGGAYSPAAVAGSFVFISGQVPKDPSSGTVVSGGVREQSRQVVANMERALGAAGATLDDIVAVTVYLADMDDWAEFDATWRELLQPPWPTRTTVGAALRGFLIEISAIAVVR